MLSLYYWQCGNKIGIFLTVSGVVDVPVAVQQQLFQAPWTGMEDGPVVGEAFWVEVGFLQERFDNSIFEWGWDMARV